MINISSEEIESIYEACAKREAHSVQTSPTKSKKFLSLGW